MQHFVLFSNSACTLRNASDSSCCRTCRSFVLSSVSSRGNPRRLWRSRRRPSASLRASVASANRALKSCDIVCACCSLSLARRSWVSQTSKACMATFNCQRAVGSPFMPSGQDNCRGAPLVPVPCAPPLGRTSLGGRRSSSGPSGLSAATLPLQSPSSSTGALLSLRASALVQPVPPEPGPVALEEENPAVADTGPVMEPSPAGNISRGGAIGGTHGSSTSKLSSATSKLRSSSRDSRSAAVTLLSLRACANSLRCMAATTPATVAIADPSPIGPNVLCGRLSTEGTASSMSHLAVHEPGCQGSESSRSSGGRRLGEGGASEAELTVMSSMKGRTGRGAGGAVPFEVAVPGPAVPLTGAVPVPPFMTTMEPAHAADLRPRSSQAG
mmetsp:Transcript_53455/g.100587  ORF Transcript_53455/g.100587 Transcript_53455/m.100587 type:complete len:385 (+) Transcript_53455:229-1383(+)